MVVWRKRSEKTETLMSPGGLREASALHCFEKSLRTNPDDDIDEVTSFSALDVVEMKCSRN